MSTSIPIVEITTNLPFAAQSANVEYYAYEGDGVYDAYAGDSVPHLYVYDADGKQHVLPLSLTKLVEVGKLAEAILAETKQAREQALRDKAESARDAYYAAVTDYDRTVTELYEAESALEGLRAKRDKLAEQQEVARIAMWAADDELDDFLRDVDQPLDQPKPERPDGYDPSCPCELCTEYTAATGDTSVDAW